MDRQRYRELVRKLTGQPFLPLLFISKAIEEAAYWHLGPAGRMSLLAAAATVVWLYTAEDVKWGLKKAEEAVDEATDDQNT